MTSRTTKTPRQYRRGVHSSGRIAALAVLLMIAMSAAAGAATGPCSQVRCEPRLDASDRWTHWTSAGKFADGVEVATKVFTRQGRVPFIGSSYNGCVGWFLGKGASVRVSLCEPGKSRLRVFYRAPDSRVRVAVKVINR